MLDSLGVDPRTLIDTLPVAIALVDSGGKLLFINEELERMLGYPPGELLGQSVELLVPEGLREHHVADRKRYLASPSRRSMGAGRELFAQRKDGQPVPVEVGLRPLEVANGATAILATIVDISARRRLESGFQAIVRAAPYGILLMDQSGRITLANAPLQNMFGYAEHELVGKTIEMLLPERSRASHVGLREAFLRAPVQRLMGKGRDLTGAHKEGYEIPIEIGLSAIPTESGPVALAAVVDITDRKRAELLLREANAQLEEFTYVSSHDLRSPIRGIGTLLEFVKEDYGSSVPPELLKNLDRMELRVKQMERLIDDLLSYARAGKRVTKIEHVDVAAVVQEVLSLDPPPANMQVTVDLKATAFQGARTPLTTVLRNLYANAVKHHDRTDGHVVIRARDEGDHCLLAVSDDGPGIPESAQGRVFRLFQTLTASERRGSGLGLAVSKRLVESHGGRISVQNNSDQKGCTFHVWWPRFMRSDLDD